MRPKRFTRPTGTRGEVRRPVRPVGLPKSRRYVPFEGPRKKILPRAIPFEEPDEEPYYIPLEEPFYVPLPDDPDFFPLDPEEEEEEERERKRPREPVPASVKKADTFGEKEVGIATKNRGEDSDPAHNSSGANFEEKGDSPELLKHIEGDGSVRDDPYWTQKEEKGKRKKEEKGKKEKDRRDEEAALAVFRSNLPLVIEYANSDKDGSQHPILKSLDGLLESVFPGYKDLESTVEEGIEVAEELLGVDLDADKEKREPREHRKKVFRDQRRKKEDKKEESREDKKEKEKEKEKTEKEAGVASLWHYGFELPTPQTPQTTITPPNTQGGVCPWCGYTHLPSSPCPIVNSIAPVSQPNATGDVNRTAALDEDEYGDYEDPEFKDLDDKDEDTDKDEDKEDKDEDNEDKEDKEDKSDKDSDVWVDENGDPLVEGADYELHSSEYAIPDRITIEKIDGDTLIFTIHSGDVDYIDEITKEDVETFGYYFTTPDNEEIDSISELDLEDKHHIRPGDDPLPQVTDLTKPPTKVSGFECPKCGGPVGDQGNCLACGHRLPKEDSKKNPFRPSSRAWLLEGIESFDKFAGKNFTPSEQREFIEEEGQARNLNKLDLKGTHYETEDSDLGTEYSLW